MRLFADDSLVFREIRGPHDHEILQEDLEKLHQWSETWHMSFNIKKCAVMTITKQTKPSLHNYGMNGETVPRVNSHDYLGVTITSNLSWNDQCNKVHAKAKRTLQLVQRTFHACTPEVKKIAYETLIRPSLEYATPAWSPHTQKNIDRLEHIQRAAARFVQNDFARRSSVTRMLSQLHWDQLSTRRVLSDVTLFYKIQHGLVGISFPPIIEPADDRTRSRHPHKYRIIRATGTLYRHSFFVRTIPVWNSLTREAVTSPTTKGFQQSALQTLRHIKA